MSHRGTTIVDAQRKILYNTLLYLETVCKIHRISTIFGIQGERDKACYAHSWIHPSSIIYLFYKFNSRNHINIKYKHQTCTTTKLPQQCLCWSTKNLPNKAILGDRTLVFHQQCWEWKFRGEWMEMKYLLLHFRRRMSWQIFAVNGKVINTL